MHARHVLDLGAGTGLLGCAALALGAQHVTFQDLNAGVLQHITAANIALNAPAQLPVPLPVTLLAGDWASVLQGVREGARECTAVGKHTVQLVLSSETLYDPRLYSVLLDLIAEVLARPTAAQAGAGAGTGDGEAGTAAARGEGGRALFATKRYYYGEGLGGGSATFLEAARAHPAGFHAERVASVEDGRTMIRDILQLTWAA